MKRSSNIPEWLAKADAEGRVTGLEKPAGLNPLMEQEVAKLRARWSKPTVYGGVKYRSKSEATQAFQLDLLTLSGEVAKWAYEPTYTLGCPENVYKPDFFVRGANGDEWCIEIKGTVTQVFRKNLRLWKRYGPCPLHVVNVRRDDRSTKIIPGGMPRKFLAGVQ